MAHKKSIKLLEVEQNATSELRKQIIRSEPRKFKRFLKWLHHFIIMPFRWLYHNARDWRTIVIFVIVFLVVSSEVWVPYLLGFITWGTTFSKTMLGVGSACWLFWVGPFTPFTVIVIGLTILVKSLFNKIRLKLSENRKKGINTLDK